MINETKTPMNELLYPVNLKWLMYQINNVNIQEWSKQNLSTKSNIDNGRSHAYDKLILIKEIKTHAHDGTDIV